MWLSVVQLQYMMVASMWCQSALRVVLLVFLLYSSFAIYSVDKIPQKGVLVTSARVVHAPEPSLHFWYTYMPYKDVKFKKPGFFPPQWVCMSRTEWINLNIELSMQYTAVPLWIDQVMLPGVSGVCKQPLGGVWLANASVPCPAHRTSTEPIRRSSSSFCTDPA